MTRAISAYLSYSSSSPACKTATVPLDPRLLAVLACPQDKGPLYYLGDDNGLYNPRLKCKYLVRDGIPVMLVEEARPLISSPANAGEGDHP